MQSFSSSFILWIAVAASTAVHFWAVANQLPTPCEMQAMIDHIDETLAIWDAEPAQLQKNVAKIVRLSFHDCVGGCDGAVNLANPANHGLETILADIGGVVTNLQALTSFPLNRADAWALIEQRTIHFTADKHSANRRRGHVPYLEFSVGRRESSAESIQYDGDVDDGEGDFPEGFHNFDQVKAVMEPFGFSDREITVLLGAHTLGNAKTIHSGYEGNWVEEIRRFNNEYYKAILNPAMNWTMERITSDIGERWQWTAVGDNGPAKLMMLDADMGLYLDFEPGETGKVGCKWAAASLNSCPLNTRTASVVQELANDNGMFMREFGPVFTKMLHHGYAPGELTHVQPVWSHWLPWQNATEEGDGMCQAERLCVGDVGQFGCGPNGTVIAPCNNLPELRDAPGAIQIVDGALVCPVTTSSQPTGAPTSAPSGSLTPAPTTVTSLPTAVPTASPTFKAPVTSAAPTSQPTDAPTVSPSISPTVAPTTATTTPTTVPTASPTFKAPVTSAAPTSQPTDAPTSLPSRSPTAAPTTATTMPTAVPTASPTFLQDVCSANGDSCSSNSDCCSQFCSSKNGKCTGGGNNL
mmetsp:Transcript_29448/g.46406  ORF Transcript_29448/g.46406 Transcript_29448/m.46406 type:complete len:582 (-) Transcript_29448:87-1832(-)